MRPLVALLPLLAAGLNGQVLINEVLFNPDPASPDSIRSHQWIELFNGGSDPVDLSGWSVAGADGVNGTTARSLPSVPLPGGGYLVVHFRPGDNQLDFTDGSGDFYTGDSGYWSADADEVGLYSPGGIVDFIDWMRSTAVYRPGQAHLDAVAANIWTLGAVLTHDQIGLAQQEQLRFVEPGDSIGRDVDSTDTNQPSDFDALGGPSGLGPTPGRQNLALFAAAASNAAPAAGFRPRADPVRKSWTVLLFMSADNNLEGQFYIKLRRLQEAGGSNANVNFVAMYDSKNIKFGTPSTTTYRGLIGPPQNLGAQALVNELAFPVVGGNDIGERDMGDPQELRDFIAWAKQTYPADKYALVLSSHGDGWKSFGPDTTFPTGTREKVDRLYMGELSTALAGQSFEWIAFDACMMAGIEVAHQLQPFAKYLLASEEVTTTGDFPYEALATNLGAHPEWTALQSITDIYKAYVPRAKKYIQQIYTVSVMDMAQVPGLSVNIRAWADLLAPGMSLFQKRDDPNDNVQVLTRKQLPMVEKFTDLNFIDLFHFGKLMLASGVPGCLLTPVQSILDIIAGPAVILEDHGSAHPNARGLHIYFPQFRMIDNRAAQAATGEPYDLLSTRTFDGSSPLAHYGLLQDQLPLKSRDPETGKDFDFGNFGPNLTPIPGVANLVWPLPQSPGFKFPNDTGWRKVLDRYYHPAADNHILKVTVNGMDIFPKESGGGACANPIDTITVPVGTTVVFSGAGSSDADQKTGLVNPTYYFWDKDDTIGCPGCMPEPHTVSPGADAGASAVTNLDADIEIANTKIDQKDGSGVRFSRACDVPGTFRVTLMVWDDDHGFFLHNTLPDAAYVHPQTARHQAVVICQAPPPPPGTMCPMSGTLNLTTTVLDDPFLSAIFIGPVGGMVNFTRSGPGGMQVSLTGSTNQLVPATGTFNPAQCSLNATGTSNFPIAGFPNVVSQYNLTIGGPKFDMVTGKYAIGLNNTLNNEPKPVTYNVTGTVTNAK